MQGSKWIPVVLNGKRVDYPVMREQKFGEHLPYYPSEYDERKRKGLQWPFIVARKGSPEFFEAGWRTHGSVTLRNNYK